jgi:hypothetical protein
MFANDDFFSALAQAQSLDLKNGGAKLPQQSLGFKPISSDYSQGKGYQELLSLKDTCKKGNYATGRKVSYSALKDFHIHPLMYVAYCQEEFSLDNFSGATYESVAMGRAFEYMLFHNGIIGNDVVVEDKPKPNATYADKDNKAYKKSLHEKDIAILTKENFDIVNKMYDVAKTCQNLTELLYPIKLEELQYKRYAQLANLNVTYVADLEKQDFILEIKTCSNLDSFRRDFFDTRSYWLQGAIMCQMSQKPVKWFVIENTYPYRYAMFYLEDEVMNMAKRLLKNTLFAFRACLRKGFNQYSQELCPLEPTWNFKQRAT